MQGEIQTVLFDKPPKGGWTYREASKWLRDNDYKNSRDVDIKKNVFRFRQQKPSKFSNYYSKKLDNGITLVYGEK